MAGKHNGATEQPVFALDIGTRSIIGIAGHAEGGLFHVDAVEVAEHPKRAMIDGQIEDIRQVAQVAGEVKARIEEKLGQPLRQVAVAAAGRALKTMRATFAMPLATTQSITPKTIFELEMAAVDEARLALNEGPDDPPYYCVGHTVVGYKLDGYPFAILLDHHGQLAEVEVLATFLPAEVVSSLRRCMELLNLEIDMLTLEPIAAMRAIIPPDVRLLNLALVDIGAGTSDIALSRDGTAAGYTMATVAGDEVTEAIIRHCLVDFETAEHIKYVLNTEKSVTYCDILGVEHTTDTADILSAASPAIDLLAQVVADKILECNGGVPAAIFLVGGGSKTPGIGTLLAEKLGLPHEKVAVSGLSFIGRTLTKDSALEGPEYATPVGIALLCQDSADAEGASVKINGRKVRLFTAQTTSVMDALLVAGYRYSDLMGRNGRSLSFTLNGKGKMIRGGHYTIAEIQMNGQPTTLQARVESGSEIAITPAVSGKDATAHIGDFADELPFTVTLNGQMIEAGLLATKNGQPTTPEAEIEEQDEVEITFVRTVQDLLATAGLEPPGLTVTVNGKPATLDVSLKQGDAVVAQPGSPSTDAKMAAAPVESVASTSTLPSPEVPDTVSISDETLSLPSNNNPTATNAAAPTKPITAKNAASGPLQKVHPSNEHGKTPPTGASKTLSVTKSAAASLPLKQHVEKTSAAPAEHTIPDIPLTAATVGSGRSLHVELNGKTVVLPPKPDAQPHLLYDMLELVDIDPKNPQGLIVLQINGAEASYLEPLSSGDSIEIHWAEK